MNLKEDFEFLRQEKFSIIKKYENQSNFNVDEAKKLRQRVLSNEKELSSRENCILKLKIQEEENSQKLELERKRNLLLNKELKVKEGLLVEKQKKVERYEEEINKINEKIENFGRLMENLILENQRLRIRKRGNFAEEIAKCKKLKTVDPEINLRDTSKFFA